MKKILTMVLISAVITIASLSYINYVMLVDSSVQVNLKQIESSNSKK